MSLNARRFIPALCTVPTLALSMLAGAQAATEPSLEELSAQWWQWSLSIPTNVNPVVDLSGEYCMVGQRGNIWFLAGTFDGSATRTCTIPEGVSLFFPVVNSAQINTPNICGQKGPLSVSEMRTNVAAFIDGIKQPSASLDGKPLYNVKRVKSIVFATTLPANNIFYDACNGDSPPGVFSPAVDDGYYAKLPPLPAGRHIVEFSAANDSGFSVNVRYELKVVKVSTHRHSHHPGH